MDTFLCVLLKFGGYPMKKYNLFDAVQKIKNIVESKEFLCVARKTSKAFTRLRKMSFCDIIYFIIGAKRRCVQHELDKFFEQKGCESMSRQAFAQAREKIKPEAIRSINDGLLVDFEKYDPHIQTMHNHRVFAVDGSLIDLPENAVLRETFGYTTGSNNSSHCKARAMIGFDVLNQICAYGELINLSTSETTKMHDISDYFAEIEPYKNCIFVLDRAYPSLNLFKKMEQNHQFYLMRAAMSFYKEIVNAPKSDQIVTITRKGKKCDVRVLKFTLSSGITEILVTNLPQNFTYEELVSLYAKRWGIETNYHYLKNVELLECFTGESVTAILQDFYAGILMLNIAAIAHREQSSILVDEGLIHPKKYIYKPNNKQLICDIKTDFVKMLSAKSKFSKVFKQLFLLIKIKRFSYAIVPDRHKPRKDPKRHSTLKSHPKMPL
jgi:Transposase DDE domain.